MTQLAATVPTTNQAKQSTPKRTIFFGLRALRDAEDNGGKERKQQHGAEVRKGHDCFLPLASE